MWRPLFRKGRLSFVGRRNLSAAPGNPTFGTPRFCRSEEQDNGMATMARFKKASWALLALAAVTATAAMVMASRWPFSQRKVTQSLQETFPATVTFQKFHSTYFPHPGCVGEEAVFTWLGSPRDTSPIVTIRRITIEAHYLDMILRPGYISKIILEDFATHVPKMGSQREPSNWKAVPSN